MSSTSITPADPSSTLGAVVAAPTLGTEAELQAPANAAASQGSVSADGRTITLPSPDPSSNMSRPANAPQSSGGGSRLKSILGAVASVVDTGLSGIPESRRPGFVTGLGGGARAEQQAQQVEQGIKFKSLDDQIRMAELHNQDLKMQNDTQEQQDAHTKAELDNRSLANSLGIDYDTLPNHGPTVMDHLTAQTAANGAASVPAGTHLSGDGKTINIPQDTQQTRDGQKAMYNMLAPALGLPNLPPGAAFVPTQHLNIMTNKIHGFDQKGDPIGHDKLPEYIAATQTQRDAMAKNGASDAQLTTLDNILGVYKANQKALDDHQASVDAAGAIAKNPDLAPVTSDNVKTFTDTTLSGYSHISPGVANGLKAEAQQAKTQGDLNKVQAKAVAMEQSGQVHADTMAATQANKQATVQNEGLKNNEKLLTDPQHGTLGALAQLSQVSSSIKAGQDGNALLTNMLPTMEVLGINHTAGITRISPAEATAAGTSPDWATRWNAFATKASTGKLTDEMANEGNQLVGILKQGALTKLYQSQSVIAKHHGIDPSTLSSVDSQGNITTFDKVRSQQTQSGGQGSQQFSHVSASGKFGWNGTQWVPIGGK